MTGLEKHQIEKQRGIVLRTYPSGESDLVLRILTEGEGKISAIAKRTRATKRSGASPLDVFDCGSFELKSGRGSLKTISHFRNDTPMHHLRDNLEVLTLAAALCESADLLILEEVGYEEGAFDVVITTLQKLSPSLTVKENCAVLFTGLGELLGLSGFLDTEQLGRGSRDALAQLLLSVEHHSERELKTKSSVFQILERL